MSFTVQKYTKNLIRNSTLIRPIDNKENRLVLVALLVLFVPIFSIEFFFALSIHFICEMGMCGDAIIQDATYHTKMLFLTFFISVIILLDNGAIMYMLLKYI